jgi:hypothetical protein
MRGKKNGLNPYVCQFSVSDIFHLPLARHKWVFFLTIQGAFGIKFSPQSRSSFSSVAGPWLNPLDGQLKIPLAIWECGQW